MDKKQNKGSIMPKVNSLPQSLRMRRVNLSISRFQGYAERLIAKSRLDKNEKGTVSVYFNLDSLQGRDLVEWVLTVKMTLNNRPWPILNKTNLTLTIKTLSLPI